MMKKVIYTCLVGNYDTLLQPEVYDDSWDYICFTDSENLKSDGVWRKKKIPYNDKDSTRLSRYPKILPHLVLPMYDVSLYIDANLCITNSKLYSICDSLIKNEILIAQVEHPFRHCVYQEVEECYTLRLITLLQRMCHYLRYKNNGMPYGWGLYENNIIYRKHNDIKVQLISEEWWKEYCRYSKRDQLSLPYVYFKNDFRPSLLFEKGVSTRNSDCIRYVNHPHDRTEVRNSSFEILMVHVLNLMDKLHILPSGLF